ncbi:hypothetical protein BD65_2141 [Yersinia ruckeri]|nr:hypothetical protein BD65_2141 [Yersinia ruckeri]
MMLCMDLLHVTEGFKMEIIILETKLPEKDKPRPAADQ